MTVMLLWKACIGWSHGYFMGTGFFESAHAVDLAVEILEQLPLYNLTSQKSSYLIFSKLWIVHVAQLM
jgi:hypothetical protein